MIFVKPLTRHGRTCEKYVISAFVIAEYLKPTSAPTGIKAKKWAMTILIFLKNPKICYYNFLIPQDCNPRPK
jgi:hypothetical protein